eukprot:Gb_31965 [translate_table: standard]
MAAMDLDTDFHGLERKQANYECQDERYELRMQRYKGQQYSHLYYSRLHKFREILNGLVTKQWPNLPVCTILGLEDGKECVVIGTLYKQMQLKPSILDEYSKERSVVPLVKPYNFMHPDDYLILEDDSGRVKLAGNVFSPSIYVTGVVIALHGKEGRDGDFYVQSILEAGLAPQRPLRYSHDSKDDKYVVFVSGLRIGGSKSNPLQFQLLVDHLTGHLGDEQEQSMTAQTVRVVIAGDSVDMQQSLLAGQPLASKDQTRLAEPIKELDLALTQLAAAMPVDIMPGVNDPANFSLPQQPLHKCLFSGASAYNTFVSATNPHQFDLDGVSFLGTSGQNIDNLEKYSDAKEKLDFMERTLKWRHLAPTAPDTLGCYPFTDRDPFVIDVCPHVYFCGNQKTYASRLLKGSEGQVVRLVCIPSFFETGTAVVVNIRNLECHLLTLSTTSLVGSMPRSD